MLPVPKSANDLPKCRDLPDTTMCDNGPCQKLPFHHGHFRKDCTAPLQCTGCGGGRHTRVFHGHSEHAKLTARHLVLDHHFSCTWCGQRNHAEYQCQYKKEGLYKAKWRQLKEPIACRAFVENITGSNSGPALSGEPHGAQSTARDAESSLESEGPLHRGREGSRNHVNLRHERTVPKPRTPTNFGGTACSELTLPGRLRSPSPLRKTTRSESIYTVSRSPYESIQIADDESVPPGRGRSRSPYRETTQLVRYVAGHENTQPSARKTSPDGGEKKQAFKILEILEQNRVEEQRHKAKMKRRREEMEIELQHERALADIRARSQQQVVYNFAAPAPSPQFGGRPRDSYRPPPNSISTACGYRGQIMAPRRG